MTEHEMTESEFEEEINALIKEYFKADGRVISEIRIGFLPIEKSQFKILKIEVYNSGTPNPTVYRIEFPKFKIDYKLSCFDFRNLYDAFTKFQ